MKYLYRGSLTQIKKFEPITVIPEDILKLKQAGILVDKIVWASDKKINALCFAALSQGISFDAYERDRGYYKVEVIKSEWEKFYDPLAPVYLYYLDSTNFIKVGHSEYVSENTVYPVKFETFKAKEALSKVKVDIVKKWNPLPLNSE